MTEADVLIIGGGPAGLSAAAELAGTDARVVIADENPQPGGQYCRAPLPGGPRPLPFLQPIADTRAALAEAATAPNIDLRAGRQLIDIDPDFRATLLPSDGGALEVVTARKVLIATGGTEDVLPFPGWTVPGVMTLGAAQTMLKAQAQVPTGDIVLAGSGPFLWLVAGQLRRAGARIAALVDSRRPADVARFGLRSLRKPGAVPEGSAILANIAPLARVTWWGWRIVGAEPGKDGTLSRVTLGKVGPDGTMTEETRVILADTLCITDRLIPDTRVARLLGARMEPDPGGDGMVPAVDDGQQGSLPGLYFAGESCGIGGAPVARNSGSLSGLAMAVALGLRTDTEVAAEAAKLRGRISRRRALAQDMTRSFGPPPGPAAGSAIADDTLVCRCEEVTAGEIRAALGRGDVDIDVVKSRSRAGMGPCQGRMCNAHVWRIMAAAGISSDQRLEFRPRAPLKPVPVGVLAAAAAPIPDKS